VNLTSIGEVRRLLAAYGLKPKKSLGQNFLVAAGVLDKIMAAADIRASDLVIEVGPGLGVLTRRLAEAGARVLAVELDAGLVTVLRDVLGDLEDRVRLVRADALQLDYSALLAEMVGPAPAGTGGEPTVKVVANLPYYITSPFVTGFLEAGHPFERLVLMVQREVAARMVARPGTKVYGALTLLIKYHTEAEIVWPVSRHCFYPPPAVDSAVVRLRKRVRPAVAVKRPDLLFVIVRAAFGRRRKMLPNALEGAIPGVDREAWGRILRGAGIDPGARGEALGLEQFGRIADAVVQMGFAPASRDTVL
jgi:16S rRNA (adenine1518-N6/adenine1519-N6)-dimethyltransferase